MSDFILKLWPKEHIQENKRELLEAKLKTHGLVSEPATHWSGKAFHATKELINYLDFDFEDDGQYSESLIICVFENDYGIRDAEEDIETFDRNNVVSIYEGDGSISNWSKLAKILEQITGDEYEGGWEIL
jgi:hypothetical protein